ncbi:MAG: hypothetical protein ABSC50_02515 [Candidatus Bathyarchaeia archaeon]
MNRLGTSNTVLNWLLQEAQPSIRYLTLTQLLEKSDDDPELRSAKAMRVLGRLEQNYNESLTKFALKSECSKMRKGLSEKP